MEKIINGKTYYIPSNLTIEQERIYCHIIDWKREHLTTERGTYKGNEYDALFPTETEIPTMLYPAVVEQWKEVMSEKVCKISLHLPRLGYPKRGRWREILHTFSDITFSSLMMLAVVIDSKDEEEQISAVSKMADERKVDLTPLLPHMKTCALVVGENNKAVLQADNGSIQFSRELSANELSRLSATLNSPGLSEESKRMRVAGMVNALVLSQQASQNFEQGMSEQQSREEQIKR